MSQEITIALLVYLNQIQESKDFWNVGVEFAKVNATHALRVLCEHVHLEEWQIIDEVGCYYQMSGSKIKAIKLYQNLVHPRPNIRDSNEWFCSHIAKM